MARKTKNPPSETDVLLTNYIDQTLGNTGKIGWSSEEVSGMVQEVMKRWIFLKLMQKKSLISAEFSQHRWLHNF